MGKITQTECGVDNFEDFVARTNEAVKTVETDDVYIEGDGNVGTELTLTAEARASIDRDFSPKVSTYTAGTGAQLDNNLGGRRYSASQTVTEIVIDETSLVDGAVVEFEINGNNNVSFDTTLSVLKNGNQLIGSASSIFMRYNQTANQLQVAYFPAAVETPIQVDTPSFNAATGTLNFSISYNSLVTGNATSAIMEISADNITFYPLDAAEYTFGDPDNDVQGVTTPLDPLIDGNIYFLRVTSSLAGSPNASTTKSAVASGSSIIQFEDDFATLGNWTSTNAPNSVEAVSANKLELLRTSTIFNFAGGLTMNPTINITTGICVVQFDADFSEFGAVSFEYFNVLVALSTPTYDVVQRIALFGTLADISKSRIVLRNSNQGLNDTADTNISTTNTFKIVYNSTSGDVDFYYLVGSTWTAFATVIDDTINIGTSVKVHIRTQAGADASLNPTAKVYISNLYISNADYTEINPTLV